MNKILIATVVFFAMLASDASSQTVSRGKIIGYHPAITWHSYGMYLGVNRATVTPGRSVVIGINFGYYRPPTKNYSPQLYQYLYRSRRAGK